MPYPAFQPRLPLLHIAVADPGASCDEAASGDQDAARGGVVGQPIVIWLIAEGQLLFDNVRLTKQ